MQKQARLFVVSDYPIVRYGLKRLVEQEPDLLFAGDDADAGKARAAIEATRPDLVLIDVAADAYRGLDLLVHLGTMQVKTLVFSRHVEPSYVQHALRLGSRGYLTYQDPTPRILEAIRQVLDGEYFLSASLKQIADRSGDGSMLAVEAPPSDALTGREQQVLELMGEGLPRRFIAERLDLSPKTIDAHRENIKRKLKLPGMAALSRYAVQWAREQSDAGREEQLDPVWAAASALRN